MAQIEMQQKKHGCKIERKHFMNTQFIVPFYFDKKKETGIYRNSRRQPYLTLRDFEDQFHSLNIESRFKNRYRSKDQTILHPREWLGQG